MSAAASWTAKPLRSNFPSLFVRLSRRATAFTSRATPVLASANTVGLPGRVLASTRPFSSTKMTFQKPSENPPEHAMAYFPNMTTSLPSESAEFRRVLFTGLYSQLVLMTVPVGGDIGDEVCD
jgi:hypothetical protein